ncbi:MAG: hypothetical protein CMC14_01035 [Flavobacteriaceae bacterium]|nr:hypothetical protein [Flavobacteriaceae bacterium]|tara:strand:+ start:1439 stop:2734 length:1296 start_codon:yes stop_codon:yes gene_type:complete
MEKYNDYKDSGVEWFGDIPTQWNVRRIKESSKKVKTGTTPSTKDGDYFSNGTENWYTPVDIKNNVIASSSRKVIKQAFKDNQISLFEEKSIYLIGIGGTLGNVAISKTKSSCNQQINVITVNEKINNPKFCFYQLILIGNTLLKWCNYTTMPIFTQTATKQLDLVLPPLKEQTQIANYLDIKTTLIDKKIKLLKQKIKHYKAYRKTLINKTVTKGLNDDISGWVKFRLKDLGFLYSGLSGKSGDDFNQDNNPKNKGFIPFTNIANNTYLDKRQLGTVTIEDNEKQNQVKKNDIFFLMSSEGYEDIGKSAVLIEDLKETYLNSFCKGYRLTSKNCDASFINYLLLSDNYRQQMLVEGKGFTRINLKMEKVNNFSILIPPTKKEQQQIAAYLDAKTSTIDDIINNIVTQIKTLKELRKTLINEVVTGKVKVTV